MSRSTKIALVAGGGGLPLEVAAYLRHSDRPHTVIRLEGLSDASLDLYQGHTLAVGDFPKLFQILSTEGCDAVCLCGYVQRPNFDAMQEEHGTVHLASIQAAGRGGDDSLLRQVAKVIEAQGFIVEGAHIANPELLIGNGLQAGPLPTPQDFADMRAAMRIANAIGLMDIGQSVVVAEGIPLAVEAQEGTQAVLKRIVTLPQNLRGNSIMRKGVLAKLPKPIQDLRLDMPTIGIDTVTDAAAAGLCGIVGRSQELLIVGKPDVFAKAEELGIFIYGYTDVEM